MSKLDNLRRMRERKGTARPWDFPDSVTVTPPDVTVVVTRPIAVTKEVTQSIQGEHSCPACGWLHKVPMTPAEKQRAHRERKRHAS